MNRLKAPLLLRPLWPYLIRDVLWLIMHKMTSCDKYAWWCACRGGGVDQRLLEYYAEDGHTDLFTAHIDMYTPICAEIAAMHGRIEIIREVHARKRTIRCMALGQALKHGRVELAEFMFNTVISAKWWREHPAGTRSMYQSAGEGGLNTTALIIRHLGDDDTNLYGLMDGAIIRNKWEVLVFLEKEHDFGMHVIGYRAAFYGNLELVKKTGYNQRTFIDAVSGGHMRVMEWLYSQGCFIRCINCSMHAEIYGPEFLEWLHQRDLYVADGREHQYSASKNRVDSSEWLVSHGYGLPTKVWYWAIQYGHMDYLTWLVEQKVPKDVGYIQYVTNIDILSLFIIGESPVELYKYAAASKNANWLVASLLELCVPVRMDAVHACRKMHPRLVQKMMQRCRKQ